VAKLGYAVFTRNFNLRLHAWFDRLDQMLVRFMSAHGIDLLR